MVREGVLPPAESGQYIAAHAKHVQIHEEGLDKLAKEMLSSMKTGKLEVPDTGADIIHPSPEHPRAADWVFITDALNFCFWTYTGAEKWTVDGHTGYYALEAALYRAIKEGQDITNPAFYSKITADELKHIFRGDNKVEIPLFEKRLSVLHEIGPILLQKYNGTFETCIKEADKSAVKLLEIVIEHFPCFRDESEYNGQAVSFYKRAQILVSDLWYFFDRTGWGEFRDIDKMTMFADYRVPQVLVYFGVLSYTGQLMEKLKKDELLPSGSDEEVEIRGCSIHAVELLKKRIEEKITSKAEDNSEIPNSSLIDYYLWCYRRRYKDAMESIPFHKTFGIFY
ncbi:queuosine salvage protein [Plutella xylostella]|uniref:queuosine salvage protein n=1 Tax=Plutella xylostella TaxID=51655 RepID=UPI0020330E05|nr:queuosine salvage protein [Plutella xylostella]XP_037968344.2 queuosine salvage protein [Plutella xylostella]XP_048489504.1 queuosine salvage protein [Plutella xylostella]XP_048489505.1 queuosine salvage protein [Plutella xylostella]